MVKFLERGWRPGAEEGALDSCQGEAIGEPYQGVNVRSTSGLDLETPDVVRHGAESSSFVYLVLDRQESLRSFHACTENQYTVAQQLYVFGLIFQTKLFTSKQVIKITTTTSAHHPPNG